MPGIGLRLLVPPAILPVTVSEAKINERITINDVQNDLLIESLLAAATNLAEEYTRRAFITQTWAYNTNSVAPIIELPRPPLQGVVDDSVFYTNWQNQSTAIPSNTYFQDIVFEPGRMIFKDGYFPYGLFYDWGGLGWGSNYWYYCTLSLEFVAGYGDTAAAVPMAIRQAILQIFGSLYQNREAQGIPCGAAQLLNPYKVEYL